MGAKNEKALLPSLPKIQTKVGYVAIYRIDDYGGRVLDKSDESWLYEDKEECLSNCQNDDRFVSIATVTWEEPA
jgi:hypothetical protein